MTVLPIVERELRVTARRAGIYRNRCLVPIVLLLILLLEWIFMPLAISPSRVGRLVYLIVSWLAFAVCVLEGVRQTADCVSEEKREGTLGLLFLTDLDGYDVVLGKLAAASLASVHGLLAMVPILGCAILLGGVTFGEVFRMAIALLGLLYFSLATGLWVSSRSRSASHAMGATILLLVVVLALPLSAHTGAIEALSPARAFLGASDAGYTQEPVVFWASLFLSPVFVLLLLARAVVNTNLFREGETMKRAGATAVAPTRSQSAWAARGRILDANAVSWLAGWNSGSPALVWLATSLAVVAVAYFAMDPGWKTFAFVFGFVLGVHLMLKVGLAADASRYIAEARRNGTLELLLCAPVKVEDMLQGQILALKRKFLKPFLIVMALEMIGVFWWIKQKWGVGAGPGSDIFGAAVAVETAFCVFFLLDIQSVAWNGMWFGLCSKNESVAAFKTAFYIIFVPLLCLLLYCVGIVLLVGWPVMAYYWARLQLQEHFRALAGLRSISSGNLTHWLPFNVPDLPKDSPAD